MYIICRMLRDRQRPPHQIHEGAMIHDISWPMNLKSLIHHDPSFNWIQFGSLSTHQTMTPAGGNLKISNHHPSCWLWVKILIQQKWNNRIDSYQFRAIVWSSMVSFWDMVIWCIIYMILKYSNRFKTKQINPNRMVIWYQTSVFFPQIY